MIDFKDKKAMLVPAIAVVILAAAGSLFYYSMGLKKELKDLRSRRQEVVALKGEYIALKGLVDAIEAKGSLTKVAGVVEAVDEVFGSIGLKQRIKSVKPTSSKELAGAFEDEAEVQVERASMNEAVNIFHKFDTAPMIMSVKKASIKTNFQDPSLLNLSITTALIRPKNEPPK